MQCNAMACDLVAQEARERVEADARGQQARHDGLGVRARRRGEDADVRRRPREQVRDQLARADRCRGALSEGEGGALPTQRLSSAGAAPHERVLRICTTVASGGGERR